MVGDCGGDVSTLDEGGVVAFGFDCGASTLVESGVDCGTSTLVEDGVVAFGVCCGVSTLVEGGVVAFAVCYGASTLVEDGVVAFAACVVVVITPVVKRPSAKLVLAIVVIFIVVCSIHNY